LEKKTISTIKTLSCNKKKFFSGLESKKNKEIDDDYYNVIDKYKVQGVCINLIKDGGGKHE